jgi:hypothetical protein
LLIPEGDFDDFFTVTPLGVMLPKVKVVGVFDLTPFFAISVVSSMLSAMLSKY